MLPDRKGNHLKVIQQLKLADAKLVDIKVCTGFLNPGAVLHFNAILFTRTQIRVYLSHMRCFKLKVRNRTDTLAGYNLPKSLIIQHTVYIPKVKVITDRTTFSYKHVTKEIEKRRRMIEEKYAPI